MRRRRRTATSSGDSASGNRVIKSLAIGRKIANHPIARWSIFLPCTVAGALACAAYGRHFTLTPPASAQPWLVLVTGRKGP